MNIFQNTSQIKKEASRLKFDFCGISKAEFLSDEAKSLEKWLNNNMHGKMSYMANYFDKRLDPRLLVDGAKSVITVVLNYYPEKKQNDNSIYKVSKYAYGKDYHFIMKEKLNELIHFIEEKIGKINGRAFVDSAPVMDKAWAKKSGLGWMGKNGNIINRGMGSYFFIGEIITDLELEYDGPIKDYCGTCKKCVEACPTNAIETPYIVNGSKCISYFTIELKDQIRIPEENKGQFDNWIFGCDVCQEVCPWNNFAQPQKNNFFEPNLLMLNLNTKEWEELTEKEFKQLFHQSAIKRTGYKGLKRNINFIRNE